MHEQGTQARVRLVGHRAPDLAEQISRQFPGVALLGEDDDAETEALLAWTYEVDRILRAAEAHPPQRWLHLKSAGVPADLLSTLARLPDVVLTNGSGAHAPAIAEYVVAVVLAFYKRLADLRELQSRAVWPREGVPMAELTGRTVGILGVGDIGLAVARRLRPFGVRLLGVRRRSTEPLAEVDVLYGPADLPAFLGQTEVLVIAAPLTPQTRGLIGAAELARLPRQAYLVNVARGPIVDEPALIAALRDGRLAGAALDVFAEEPLPPSSPLWRLPNVTISPHASDQTPGTEERALAIALDNLSRFLRGESLRNSVDRQAGY